MLVFAAMTGISFAFAYVTSGEPSQIGTSFAILNLISQNFDPGLQNVIMIVSAALAIYFVFSLAKFFREVYENRLYGVLIAVLGFSGSILIILASSSSNGIVLGVAFWLVGVILAVYKNKIKN
ncbi:MAG: hypothetical protein HW420_1530 [Candidatus Nitrosotenuis sp.]|nr:hypothetical protein [Candidatus Nitrosotenuis sp.]